MGSRRGGGEGGEEKSLSHRGDIAQGGCFLWWCCAFPSCSPASRGRNDGGQRPGPAQPPPPVASSHQPRLPASSTSSSFAHRVKSSSQ
eukprot:765390-Hanusia_phi.AAC.5